MSSLHSLSLLLLEVQLLLDVLLLLQLNVTFVSLRLLVLLQLFLVALAVLLRRLHIFLFLFGRKLRPLLGHDFHDVRESRAGIRGSDLLPPLIQKPNVACRNSTQQLETMNRIRNRSVL